MRLSFPPLLFVHRHFYSRTPCEVRRSSTVNLCCPGIFLLTHPMRGATKNLLFCVRHIYQFLLTHPMRGATESLFSLPKITVNFYSRTPCEVRRWTTRKKNGRTKFLLTHPMRGATNLTLTIAELLLFLLTHPMRGATMTDNNVIIAPIISTHAPHARCDSTPSMSLFAA